MTYLFSFLIALLYTSNGLAETPTVTISAINSLQRGQIEATEICNRLKGDPNCKADLDLLKNTLGLSVANCQAQKEIAKCGLFFQKFPKYKAVEMKCHPYEICRMALDKAFAEGCKSYGIELKNSLVQAIKESGACLADAACYSKNLLLSLLKLNPVILRFKLQNDISNGIQSFVESLQNDKELSRRLACLNTETQMQLACYWSVKYGSAVIGGLGVAKSAVNLFMSRMALVETDLTASKMLKSSELTESKTPILKIEDKSISNSKTDLLNKIKQRLGFEPTIKTKLDPELGNTIKIVNPETNEVIAKTEWYYHEDLKQIELDLTKVDDEIKGLGINNYFVEAKIKSHPDAQEILVRSLILDNERIYKKYLAEGYTQNEAIRETPAYKSLAKMGFPKILKVYNGSNGFKVGK